VTVDDPAILAAMGLVVRHLKVVVEPAGAAGLAGGLAGLAGGLARLGGEELHGRRVGVLLSGGNTGMERVRAVL